jgi:hypothetical protein
MGFHHTTYSRIIMLFFSRTAFLSLYIVWHPQAIFQSWQDWVLTQRSGTWSTSSLSDVPGSCILAPGMSPYRHDGAPSWGIESPSYPSPAARTVDPNLFVQQSLVSPPVLRNSCTE